MTIRSAAMVKLSRSHPDVRRPWSTYVSTVAPTTPPLMHAATSPMVAMLAPTTYAVTPVTIAEGPPLTTPAIGSPRPGLRDEFEEETD